MVNQQHITGCQDFVSELKARMQRIENDARGQPSRVLKKEADINSEAFKVVRLPAVYCNFLRTADPTAVAVLHSGKQDCNPARRQASAC